MRIVVLTSSYPRFSGDGAAPFVKSIAEGYKTLDHEVVVIAPYDVEVVEEPGVNPKVYRFKYIWPNKFHIMGHARSLNADVRLRLGTYFLLPLFIISQFLHLLIIARQFKAQAIHVNWVLPNGLAGAAAAGLLKIPFILSLHGSDMYVAKKNFLYRALAKWIFSQAGLVSACSENLKEDAIFVGADPDKIRLLAWGADPSKFSPDLRTRSRVNPNEDVVVLGLGRLVYKKGFEVLLNSWQNVIKAHPQAQLYIGGDGPLFSRFESTIREANLQESVHLLGRVAWDAVPQLLANADIFVLPSIRDQHGNLDGLPTVLLEAMSCGNAVVASNIGGVPLVIEDRVNGILVSSGDSEALSKALLSLMQDAGLRNKISNSARSSVLEKYNWLNVAKALSHMMEECIE